MCYVYDHDHDLEGISSMEVDEMNDFSDTHWSIRWNERLNSSTISPVRSVELISAEFKPLSLNIVNVKCHSSTASA